MNKVTTVLAALFLLAGCATKPIDISDSHPIAEDRIYAPFEQYSVRDDARAKVSFTRDSGMLGAAASLSLYVNGELIAHIRRKETVSLYLPAGPSQIALGPGKATAGPIGAGLIEEELFVRIEEEYSYRIGLDMSKGLVLERQVL